MFITFEGIDGAGKTTIIERLKELMIERFSINPEDIIIIREPGGTPVAEDIRNIIMKDSGDMTEFLLFQAARAELVDKVIRPNYHDKIILCDRFIDSTTAYQGYGRGIDLTLIETLTQHVVGDCLPHLTVLLDIDLETSSERLHSLEKDRFDHEEDVFKAKVLDGYHLVAADNKERIVTVDAKRPIEEIIDDILEIIEKRI